jgi:hypothetical protein
MALGKKVQIKKEAPQMELDKKVKDMQGEKSLPEKEEAQPTQEAAQMVVLPLEVLNKVIGALMQRPYSEVFQTIDEIKQSVRMA